MSRLTKPAPLPPFALDADVARLLFWLCVGLMALVTWLAPTALQTVVYGCGMLLLASVCLLFALARRAVPPAVLHVLCAALAGLTVWGCLAAGWPVLRSVAAASACWLLLCAVCALARWRRPAKSK
jgi:hypothetical protein